MDQKIEVTKITLTIGKKEIQLTPDEGRKLLEALTQLYGKDQVVKHEWNYRPWWVVSSTNETYGAATNSAFIACNTEGVASVTV